MSHVTRHTQLLYNGFHVPPHLNRQLPANDRDKWQRTLPVCGRTEEEQDLQSDQTILILFPTVNKSIFTG